MLPSTGSPMHKPWWQSLTIRGALITGASILTSPAVLDLLPQKWTTAIGTVGGVLTAIGLRRALP